MRLFPPSLSITDTPRRFSRFISRVNIVIAASHAGQANGRRYHKTSPLRLDAYRVVAQFSPDNERRFFFTDFFFVHYSVAGNQPNKQTKTRDTRTTDRINRMMVRLPANFAGSARSAAAAAEDRRRTDADRNSLPTLTPMRGPRLAAVSCQPSAPQLIKVPQRQHTHTRTHKKKKRGDVDDFDVIDVDPLAVEPTPPSPRRWGSRSTNTVAIDTHLATEGKTLSEPIWGGLSRLGLIEIDPLPLTFTGLYRVSYASTCGLQRATPRAGRTLRRRWRLPTVFSFVLFFFIPFLFHDAVIHWPVQSIRSITNIDIPSVENEVWRPRCCRAAGADRRRAGSSGENRRAKR